MSKKGRPSYQQWHFRNPKFIVDDDVFEALERVTTQQSASDWPRRNLTPRQRAHEVRNLIETVLQQFIDQRGDATQSVIPLDVVPWSSSPGRSVRIARPLQSKLQEEARRQTRLQQQYVSVKRLAHAILTAYLAKLTDERGSADPRS